MITIIIITFVAKILRLLFVLRLLRPTISWVTNSSSSVCVHQRKNSYVWVHGKKGPTITWLARSTTRTPTQTMTGTGVSSTKALRIQTILTYRRCTWRSLLTPLARASYLRTRAAKPWNSQEVCWQHSLSRHKT